VAGAASELAEVPTQAEAAADHSVIVFNPRQASFPHEDWFARWSDERDAKREAERVAHARRCCFATRQDK
jgi:hypothetical protein